MRIHSDPIGNSSFNSPDVYFFKFSSRVYDEATQNDVLYKDWTILKMFHLPPTRKLLFKPNLSYRFHHSPVLLAWQQYSLPNQYRTYQQLAFFCQHSKIRLVPY